ncbi:ATPase [Arthroderma uncinatum]|uniref:ATPase n=1 Tax=Arthroderma uncinatum TaxID=74035 RepID=UPI00144AE098|nr:ATPase [Arthroderma uncinatum]KAF3492388.1 ATPase [Arthroderma uncinatum]
MRCYYRYTVSRLTSIVNIALSFARRGFRTGILDTDIFGPSIPTLLNLSGEPRLDGNNCLVPLTNYGLKSMSMGYLLPPPPEDARHLTDDPNSPLMDTTPISWRGLMVSKAMNQLLHSVSWGPLDILILDLPPGTGDVQLTINQEIVVDGAVIVSTPQDIALRDAVRGFGLFEKMNVPVLGMVRNMAYFACPHCGKQTKIFSRSGSTTSVKDEVDEHEHSDNTGVVAACKRLGIDFLGDIPLDARVCEDADRGMPTVVAEERDDRSARRNAFLDVSKKVAEKIGLQW